MAGGLETSLDSIMNHEFQASLGVRVRACLERKKGRERGKEKREEQRKQGTGGAETKEWAERKSC